MNYCSSCKNMAICKYTSETLKIKKEVDELKKTQPGIYTITFKCNHFESEPTYTLKTAKWNEPEATPYLEKLTR